MFRRRDAANPMLSKFLFFSRRVDSSLRLHVELIPMPLWRTNVRSKVMSREWKRLRGIVLEAAGHRCEVCGAAGERRALDCNEVWEYDDVRQIQRLVRLEALCPACHAAKHIGREIVQGRGKQAADHLAEVNGWTWEQTKQYIAEVFDRYKTRSAKQEWTQNLEALSQYGSPLAPAPPRQRRCANCDELFPRDQLTADAETNQLLCEECYEEHITGGGYEMWPDHEFPPMSMGDPDR